ncbi:MAG: FkbM family methyltransferase [Acidobacteriota bacterium]|jgi:hypothetical protein
MMTDLIKRVIASCSWRMRRLRFAAAHEWLRSPPYVLRYAGFDLLYNPGNALALRYCLNGAYEPEVERYLESALKPGSVVVDAGANIGFFSLAVLGKSEGATVHGFEPSPGSMDFQIHDTSYGAYDGFRDTGYAGVGESRTIKVPVTTLDIYAKQVGLDRLDLLKIDVEGAELFVLRGAREVLSSLHPTVLFEVGHQNLRPFGILPSDLYKFFEDVGYRVMSLNQRALSEVDFGHASIAEHEFIALPKTELAGGQSV